VITLAGFIVCGSWPAEVLAKVVDYHKDEDGKPLVRKEKPIASYQFAQRKSLKIWTPRAFPKQSAVDDDTV